MNNWQQKLKPKYEMYGITDDFDLNKLRISSISWKDLEEDCILIMDNGLVLKFIGQINTRTDQEYLFKTMYSPFATTTWIELTPEKIKNLKVIKLIKTNE